MEKVKTAVAFHRPHSDRPNRNRIRHKLNAIGLATLCEKDPARVVWAVEWESVTCERCLKAAPPE
jgi:hypothetical protein